MACTSGLVCRSFDAVASPDPRDLGPSGLRHRRPAQPGGRTLKRMNRRLLTIDLVLKAALVLLLLHAVVFPDLPQYQGKGIGWRLLLYPTSSCLWPLGAVAT